MSHNVESDGTISGRSLTPEERVKYKEFKGQIFSRVACHFCPEKDQQIARLKDAAKGIGMVSEMADMSEVAVLVVGLHTEIAALQAKLDAAHADVRALAEDLQMAQGQWGDNYLWGKWGCGDSLARPSVRTIVEGV